MASLQPLSWFRNSSVIPTPTRDGGPFLVCWWLHSVEDIVARLRRLGEMIIVIERFLLMYPIEP
jgi:hypothetical protein